MKPSRLFTLILVLTMAGSIPTGCGHKDSSDHAHDAGHAEGEEHGHGHDESASGATFKSGIGIILSEDTRHSLGIETAEVTRRKLPLEIQFTAQVFGEEHKFAAAESYHAECTAKAAGLIAQDKAVEVHAGESVVLAPRSGESLGGVVLGVTKALAIGDVEVVIGITNAAAQLKSGEFLSATIVIPREQPVVVIPRSALLRSAEGTFVYTVNGGAYFRAPVKIGAETQAFVEITSGLNPGDKVVTTPVEKLWLIELRATKGGGHSH